MSKRKIKANDVAAQKRNKSGELPEPRRLPPERPGPQGGRRDANRRQRIAQLAAAGLALFVERGIDLVTVDDIVGRAGVAKGSFYRYVNDKTELVSIIAEPMADEVRAAMERCEKALGGVRGPGELTAAYVTLAGQLGEAINRHPDVLRLYLQESRAPARGARRPLVLMSNEIEERAIALAEVAHRHGLLRGPNPPVEGLAVLGAVERLLLAHYSGREIGTPGEVGPALVSVILDGVRRR